MRIAFTKSFGSNPRPFGNQATVIGGFSDDNQGVQWNAGYDPTVGRRWVGVNLEGMVYDDWPIARLIERELENPTLLDLLRKKPQLRPVQLLWRRDYWQATSRPEIQERWIGDTPMAMSDLDESGWQPQVILAVG